jgi:hypothetical protein
MKGGIYMKPETQQALINSGKIILTVAAQAAFAQLLIELQKHIGFHQPNKR